MKQGDEETLTERVLVLAPTPGDAGLSHTLVQEAGLACHVCSDLSVLGQEFERGAGALLLTEEVLSDSAAHCLADFLRLQPPWSDVPILLLTSAGADSPAAVCAMKMLGNVTLLERPVRVNLLVSALRAALKARRLQYELRNQAEAARASAISEQKRVEEELRKTAEQLRIVTESMAAPVTRSSKEFRYLWVSKHFADWIARPVHEIIGRPMPEIIGQEAFNQLLPYYEQALAGKGVSCEKQIHYQGLGPRWINAVYTPTVDIHGVPDGWVAVTVDIDDRKRMEKALQDADRHKDEFLATLAHELRNPLAPLRNGLQIMRLAVDQNTIDQARTMMDRQLAQLVRLVDDLLDVSRISRGKIELRRERVSLESVINNAVETSLPLIEHMGHELTIKMPQLPVIVDVDLTRMSQVFLNLLNNAAKYMEPEGHIWLTAEREGSEVVVSVKDTGIGIAPEQLPHVFTMFTQLDHSLERSQGGLGIGLTLVTRLLELHGGRIEARSAGPGMGSEFVVRLPIALEPAAPKREQDKRESRNRISLRILVADDNRDGAESLALLLGMMGHETRTAYDGLAALETLKAFHPDLVLLDLGMPKLNGYDTCRRIREQACGKNVVLVALTGWGQEEDKRRSREAGFDQHLVKPVDSTALDNLLAGLRSCNKA